MSSQTKYGVKGRAYLTPEGISAAARQFGCARFVYNHLLEFSQTRYFADKTRTSPAQRSKELTELKTKTPWLREVNAQSLQQTGRALDTAYKNWFDSITVVLSMTPSGRYYVSFQVEQPLRVVGSANNTALSVDINTKTFNFFNGRTWSHVALPRPLLAALSRLRTAQKHLNRCKKGSKNRDKARLRVAKIYQRTTDMRTDFLQKLSTQLVHENQVIIVETLRTKNMLKNRRLARAISDAGFGDFIRMLEYKSKWYGRTFVKVDTFFASSKHCCICHWKNAELKLQDRWPCPNCQTEHQRDENAVVNIFVEGLRILAEGRSVSACGGTVRLRREPKRAPVKQETSLETSSHAA